MPRDLTGAKIFFNEFLQVVFNDELLQPIHEIKRGFIVIGWLGLRISR